jgi:DNA-binding NtrC family response regulator
MQSALSPQIVLVEPNDVARGVLATAAARLGQVESYGQFEAARTRLRAGTFDFLVTNIRLGAYNGLHLAYLIAPGTGAPRAIVYSDERNPGLAREAHRAGAFYEVGACLPVTLAAYFTGSLPLRDRRDAAFADRRASFRGGRRCWDAHLLSKQRH